MKIKECISDLQNLLDTYGNIEVKRFYCDEQRFECYDSNLEFHKHSDDNFVTIQ